MIPTLFAKPESAVRWPYACLGERNICLEQELDIAGGTVVHDFDESQLDSLVCHLSKGKLR